MAVQNVLEPMCGRKMIINMQSFLFLLSFCLRNSFKKLVLELNFILAAKFSKKLVYMEKHFSQASQNSQGIYLQLGLCYSCCSECLYGVFTMKANDCDKQKQAQVLKVKLGK